MAYSKRITYFGLVKSISSWAKVAREMCLALISKKVPLEIVQRKGFLYDEMFDLGELKSVVSENFNGEYVFTFEHPKNYAYLPKDKKNIGFLVYEFTQLPSFWVESINNNLHMVFVPSQFVRDVFINSGVRKEKIKILRYGFNPKHYYHQTEEKGKFVFFSVASPHKREAVDTLLNVFSNTFEDNNDVLLKLKLSYMPSRAKSFEIRDFKGLLFDYKQKLKEKLQIIDLELSESDMGALYRKSDVYVSFSKAEAFGLPFLEAIASNKPVICLNYSGQKDFLDSQNSYFVPHKMEIAKNEEYENSSLKQFSASVLKDMAEKTLREVYFGRENLKIPALKEGLKHYYWDSVAQEFMDILKL